MGKIWKFFCLNLGQGRISILDIILPQDTNILYRNKNHLPYQRKRRGDHQKDEFLWRHKGYLIEYVYTSDS